MAVADPKPCECGGDYTLGVHTIGCPRVYMSLPFPPRYCQACGTAADQCVENPHGYAYHHEDRWPRAGDHTLVPYDRIGQTGGLPSAPLTGVHHVGWDLHAERGAPVRPYDDSDTTGGTW